LFNVNTCLISLNSSGDNFYHYYRQSLQCKEATPPVQNKTFTRPPSCARRHLVFDADHGTPFNSIDSGFGDEYILPKSRDGASEEQVSTL